MATEQVKVVITNPIAQIILAVAILTAVVFVASIWLVVVAIVAFILLMLLLLEPIHNWWRWNARYKVRRWRNRFKKWFRQEVTHGVIDD